MDKLKVLFGDGALTFDKFLEALGAQKNCSISFCQKTKTSLRDAQVRKKRTIEKKSLLW